MSEEQVDSGQELLTDAVVEPSTEQKPFASPLEELQQEFAAQVAERRLYKRFPARGGKLAGEYKPLPAVDAKAAVKADNDEDLLISSLVRVMRVEPGHPNANSRGLVPLGDWAGKPEEDPLRFDHRLASLLGVHKGTTRQIALALFEGNTLALATQGGELATWTVEEYSEALQDFAIGS